jgi:hypothetical protein
MWPKYLDPRYSPSGRPDRAAGRVPGSLYDTDFWDSCGNYIQSLPEWQKEIMERELDTPLAKRTIL